MVKNKSNKKLYKSATTNEILLDLITSALKKDVDEVELSALTLSRKLKNIDPTLSQSISHLIGSYSMGGSMIRSSTVSPIPLDNETQLEMATILSPNIEIHNAPVLSAELIEKVNGFLQERMKADILLAKNVRPTTSLLLVGPPGTGKTMLATYIASALNKNLVILDLAASISSLLGKTGYNLKRVLKYARQTASVLLLDEFDAIAKRRDDPSDLGELKRVVNVLLMELETWPISSVVIATSNHPDLLDHAIWRRFDHILKLDLPKQEERYEILRQKLSEFIYVKNFDVLLPISELLEGRSPADICRFADNVMRRSILNNINPVESCLEELSSFTSDKEAKGKYVKLAKKLLGKKVTVRELSKITGLSASGVQYHLQK